MIRTMIIVVLIGILLSGCCVNPDGTVKQSGGRVSSNPDKISTTPLGYVIARHIDYDAGVVCYTFKDGIDCMAIEETKLR